MESAEEERFLEGSLLLFCNFALVFIFVGGLASNLLVLLVFYRKPGLRTTANRFVINLMIINLVSCLSLLPITFANNTALTADNYFCFSERFSSIFCSSAIIYSILLIAIDQYFAVLNPLHYHCIISSWKGYLMIVATWGFCVALALLGSVPPEFGIQHKTVMRRCGIHADVIPEYHKESYPSGIVEVSPVKSSVNFYHVMFGVAYVTTAFLVPFGLICFIYYSICVAASGNSKRARTSVLSSDETAVALRSKCQHGPYHSSNRSPSEDKHSDSGLSAPMESSATFQTDGSDASVNPSFVVTRPSPPKFVTTRLQNPTKNSNADKSASESQTYGKMSPDKVLCVVAEKGLKTKVESIVPLLKPTLKNSSSFTKLSSLHIQFSSSTEKIMEKSQKERRHSNILLSTVDPEFENLDKSKSTSMQSSFCDSSNRSFASSTRSTTQIQSSRSSSLNSGTYARLPPSRASSIRSTSSYIVHNIRHRISNASFFRYREEARAARISAMVIVMGLFCWLPFFTVISFNSGACLGKLSRFPYYLDAFAIVFLLSSTIFSPFLFAFRNRKIKKEIRKIFKFCPGCAQTCCSKLFYSNNISRTLQSQSVQLLTGLEKNVNLRQSSPPDT